MSNIFDMGFYEYLCDTIENCVREVLFEELKDKQKILVLGTNMTEKFRTFLGALRKVNLNAELIIIAQPQMIDKMGSVIDQGCSFMEWEDAYNEKLLIRLKTELDLSEVDAFVSFCGRAIDLRNQNIMQMAMALNENHAMDIYGMSASRLYGYVNLPLLDAGLTLYNAINVFAGLSLEYEKQTERSAT